MTKPLTQVYERYGGWLPPAVAAVFAVVIGIQAAQIVWALMPQPDAARWRPAPAQASQTAAQPATALDVNTIVSAALFGRFQAPAVSRPIQTLPDTRLNLTLIGILSATDERGSRALIAQPNGEQKPYAIGDDVARGVQLHAVYPDRVILVRDGQMETLRLDRDRASSDTSPPAAFATPQETPSALPMPRTTSAPDPAQLAEIRNALLSDPSKAQDFIRVVPASVAGQQRGYRIYPGRDRALFSAAGLRPGDLVTSVNGVDLDDPARALQLLGDLSQATTLNVTVERGGQSQNITLSID